MSFLDGVVQFRCTLCDAPMGECDCWHQCECGWFYPDGGECTNPVHPNPARSNR